MTPGVSALLELSWLFVAADPASPDPGAPLTPAIPDVASMFGRMLLIVAALCGLMLAAVWWVRRVGRARGAGAGLMRVTDTLELGQGRRLMLVEVQGRMRLIGVTPQSITDLSGGAPTPLAPPAAGGEETPTFAGVFRGPGWAARREGAGAEADGTGAVAGRGVPSP